MADFIVVRQPPGPFVRVHNRFYRCLPTSRLIRPGTISDFGVSPPTNPQLVIDIIITPHHEQSIVMFIPNRMLKEISPFIS
jgi:hypothetical protein